MGYIESDGFQKQGAELDFCEEVCEEGEALVHNACVHVHSRASYVCQNFTCACTYMHMGSKGRDSETLAKLRGSTEKPTANQREPDLVRHRETGKKRCHYGDLCVTKEAGRVQPSEVGTAGGLSRTLVSILLLFIPNPDQEAV